LYDICRLWEARAEDKGCCIQRAACGLIEVGVDSGRDSG